MPEHIMPLYVHRLVDAPPWRIHKEQEYSWDRGHIWRQGRKAEKARQSIEYRFSLTMRVALVKVGRAIPHRLIVAAGDDE